MGLPALPVNRNPETEEAAILMRGQSGGRIDPARDHVHPLHRLGWPPRDSQNKPSRRCGRSGPAGMARIQARQRGHIVGCELVRIGIANRDRNAGNRVHEMHHGKAGVVVGCGIGGLPVITFRFICDQPNPITLPSTRTSRYSTSVSCDDCSAHWPLMTTRRVKKIRTCAEVVRPRHRLHSRSIAKDRPRPRPAGRR